MSCQHRGSSYPHSNHGLELNLTGRTLPSPLGSSECHNMEDYWERLCIACVSSASENTMTSKSPLTFTQPLPMGQKVPEPAPLPCNRNPVQVQVLRPSKPLIFYFWESGLVHAHTYTHTKQFSFFALT